MGRKHWEKEKLLVTSNFSFPHSVFKRLGSQGRQKVSLCGNGLNDVDTCSFHKIKILQADKLVIPLHRSNLYRNLNYSRLFSTLEHNVLRGAFRIMLCPPFGSNISFKHTLLLNRWANLNQTWQEYSLGGPL